MENATKALLIAAAMLILILVLTLAIYIFRQVAGQTSELYSKIEQSDIDEFNQRFLQYEDKELRIQDVISIINMAKDNDETKKMPVTVTVNSETLGHDLQNKKAEDLNQMLAQNIDKRYICEVEYANKSKLVGKITIKNTI